MDVVTGFHACRREFADGLRDGGLKIKDWLPSTNSYDWLGTGIYFWENSFRRAEEWAREFITGSACIVKAQIDLGNCLDLTETRFLDLIQQTYENLVELYRAEGLVLPVNRDLPVRSSWQRLWLQVFDWTNARLYRRLANIEFHRVGERKLRSLDCLVINRFLELVENGAAEDVSIFQTVRCPFEEGRPLFPGSMIRRQTHIQLSVRDVACISSLEFIDV